MDSKIRKVENEEKLYSICELHTDIIVKGSRETKFGHKVNFASGKSSLILGVETVKGNPSDSSPYSGMTEKEINAYQTVPRDSAADGGYASLSNREYARFSLLKDMRRYPFRVFAHSHALYFSIYPILKEEAVNSEVHRFFF